MNKLTVHMIIGLPGSGKTYLASQMDGYLVDDIKSIDELPTKKDKDWIITDPNFCDNYILLKAQTIIRSVVEDTNVNFVCHYFENDPVKAINNVKYRNDGRDVQGTINRFTKIYNPPRDKQMEIWQCQEANQSFVSVEIHNIKL